MTECALWYWSHRSVFVTLCEDEAEAIDDGIAMEDSESGSVAGIQRADGSYTDRDEWAEYQAEKDRRLREEMDEIRSRPVRPQPQTWEVSPPFETRYGDKARVTFDPPAWLGRQVSLAGEAPGGATGSAESPGGTSGETNRG